MTSPGTYKLLADIVLVIHFAFVAFVVVGLLIIWLGFFLRWRFVRNFYFRAAHILSMAVVLLESIFGVVCPLTEWEIQLRELGDQVAYGGQTFIQYWVHKVMFFQWEETTFEIIYFCFFTALVLSFVFVRPKLPGWIARKNDPETGLMNADNDPEKPETDNDPRDSRD